MELKFDANQQFQLDAIAAAVPNRLDLTEAALLENLQGVQKANNVTPDSELECIEERIETAAGPKDARHHVLPVSCSVQAAVTSTSTECVREPSLGRVGSVDVSTLAEPAVSVPSGSNEGHAPSTRHTTPGIMSSVKQAGIRTRPSGLLTHTG